MGISRMEFSKRAGLSRSAVYKLIGQEVNEVKLETLCKLARALNVSPLDLCRLALGLCENDNHRPRPRKDSEDR